MTEVAKYTAVRIWEAFIVAYRTGTQEIYTRIQRILDAHPACKGWNIKIPIVQKPIPDLPPLTPTPAFSGSPATPGFLEFQGSPAKQPVPFMGIPFIPAIPFVPAVPLIPQIPPRPALPALPYLPAEPAPLPKTPRIPALPAIKAFPDIPALPELPAIPALPNSNPVPAQLPIPAILGMPALPAIPAIPAYDPADYTAKQTPPPVPGQQPSPEEKKTRREGIEDAIGIVRKFQ